MEFKNTPLYPIFKQALEACLDYLIVIILISAALILLFAVYCIIKHKVILKSKANPLLVMTDGILQGLFYFIRKIPLLFVILCFACVFNSVLDVVNNVNQYVNNQKKIKELTAVVKNLSRTDLVCRITVTDKQTLSGASGKDSLVKSQYRVDLFDLDGNVINTDEYEIAGDELWIDSMCINFDYSEISSADRVNIAYPYRLYSEKISPEDGIQINNLFNKDGVPLIYELNKEQVLGMEYESYVQRVKELFGIIQNTSLRSEYGIRSFNGSVLHQATKTGQVYNVSVNGSGGLTLTLQDF